MLGRPSTRSDVLAVLQAHQRELRADGVETITLFGSVARGDATGTSDVDLAIRSGENFSSAGFDHFGRLDALRARLAALLGCHVDLVERKLQRARGCVT